MIFIRLISIISFSRLMMPPLPPFRFIFASPSIIAMPIFLPMANTEQQRYATPAAACYAFIRRYFLRYAIAVASFAAAYLRPPVI